MKKIEQVIQYIIKDIENKNILEVACGVAEFSLTAAKHTENIVCIDIDDKRLDDCVRNHKYINFQIMNAAEMTFENEIFDTIVLCNALYHIKSQYDTIIAECKRVLKQNGKIYIIGTWKLDISLMSEMFGDRVNWLNECCIIEIDK